MDIPRHACISYVRLCYERNVSKINKFKVEMAKSPFWKGLMEYKRT